jgi:hypothetical protein
VKDFYSENYKALKKKTEEDNRIWKISQDHELAELKL